MAKTWAAGCCPPGTLGSPPVVEKQIGRGWIRWKIIIIIIIVIVVVVIIIVVVIVIVIVIIIHYWPAYT